MPRNERNLGRVAGHAYRQEWSQERGTAPQPNTEPHDDSPGVPIAQVSEYRCKHHVGHDKHCLEEAGAVIADLELFLHID